MTTRAQSKHSRLAGKNAEKQVCSMLVAFTGKPFVRVPMSGAIGNAHAGLRGDVRFDADDETSIIVEVKKRANIDVGRLLFTGEFDGWCKQALHAARNDEIPWLVFLQNRDIPWLCVWGDTLLYLGVDQDTFLRRVTTCIVQSSFNRYIFPITQLQQFFTKEKKRNGVKIKRR